MSLQYCKNTPATHTRAGELFSILSENYYCFLLIDQQPSLGDVSFKLDKRGEPRGISLEARIIAVVVVSHVIIWMDRQTFRLTCHSRVSYFYLKLERTLVSEQNLINGKSYRSHLNLK